MSESEWVKVIVVPETVKLKVIPVEEAAPPFPGIVIPPKSTESLV